MNRSYLKTSLSVAILFIVSAVSGIAQPKRPDFNRPQTFDAQNYTIRASFDRTKKMVFGDTTVSLRPLKANFRTVELDAVDLRFDSVALDPSGIALQYKSSNGMVIVTLDKAYGPDDVISIRFKYSTTPKKGVYFSPAEKDDKGVERHSDQIWSQGEAEEARHWFPSFDFPSDKATTEEYITADKGETVIGNGEFLGKAENSDGTITWHFKMPIPHSTYLVSFVIGKYVKVEDKYKDIPLGFYTYPGRENTAKKAFGDTKEMIAVYEQLTGVPFPFNKYDQTVVSQFQFGGMENITATTMNDIEIFMADFDFGKSVTMDLVSHELAHSWFGDLVTCRNWAELWLNEGFATYMEAAYREKIYGREDYLNKVRSDAAEFLVDDVVNKRRHPLYDLRAADVDGLFDNAATTYHKGGVVLHMLREQVGTEAFWKGVNAYLNSHKFANVESTDLKKAMEDASGQDLTWFFDQWVYSGGAPRLEFKQAYNTRTRSYTLTVTQTQSADTITPGVFKLQMDIIIHAGGAQVNEKLNIKQRVQSFIFKTAGKPSRLEVDKTEKIALKAVTIKPVTPTAK
ncbi:hypothetical protein BH10ACI3_BH10ACI3_17760 [soil metagenome]